MALKKKRVLELEEVLNMPKIYKALEDINEEVKSILGHDEVELFDIIGGGLSVCKKKPFFISHAKVKDSGESSYIIEYIDDNGNLCLEGVYPRYNNLVDSRMVNKIRTMSSMGYELMGGRVERVSLVRNDGEVICGGGNS